MGQVTRPPDRNGKRWCRRCEKWLPLEEFNRDRSEAGLGGRRTDCRYCRAAQRASYKERKAAGLVQPQRRKKPVADPLLEEPEPERRPRLPRATRLSARIICDADLQRIPVEIAENLMHRHNMTLLRIQLEEYLAAILQHRVLTLQEREAREVAA